MREDSVIEVRQLADLLSQPGQQPLLLDCRYDLTAPDAGERAFAAAHIPGARYASLHRDLSGPLQRYGGRHPLPPADEFQRFARAAGIGRDNPVILYDDSRIAFAARAWWLLRHFGHRRVAILNGGFSAWRDAGLPLESGAARPRAEGNFTADPDTSSLVQHGEIYRQLDNPPWQLIDARDPQRFAGVEEPLDPIAGHIPTALNKPWQGVTREDGTIKGRSELLEHWRDIPADEQLLNYCGSGVTACVNLFSLHLIGRGDALLYPGSWSDWCAHMLFPATGEPHAIGST
ncbi:sulfurtransferase [Microbulbifer litoralis]|uniref:sulfurtransferase n=1 Tax=Microbulbifer litoralis TaxID=2933965 RepID=UPI0020279E5B|nr:sulfurtransferase [Microbulbifer sp. GX H0434]